MNRPTVKISRALLIALALGLIATATLSADEPPETPSLFPVLKEPLKIFCADGEDDCYRHLFGGGYLGVQLTRLTPELRLHLGGPEEAGVIVSRVTEDSPAAEADLRVGDIITAIDGNSVRTDFEIARRIRSKKEDEVADIDFYRDGELHQVAANIRKRELKVLEMGEMGLSFEELGDQFPGLSHQSLQKALASAQKALQGQDWQAHVKRLHSLDLDGVDERMEMLQERLEVLEKQLQQLGGETEQ